MPVQHQHANSGSLQISLGAVARLVAWDEEADLILVRPTTARKEVMGLGAAGISSGDKRKGEIVRWLNRRGYAVTNHNCADALICWLWDQGYRTRGTYERA